MLIWYKNVPKITEGNFEINVSKMDISYYCAPPPSTPQSASAPYRCCPLLSRFEYIDRRTCPGPGRVPVQDMSWTGTCPGTGTCPVPGHVLDQDMSRSRTCPVPGHVLDRDVSWDRDMSWTGPFSPSEWLLRLWGSGFLSRAWFLGPIRVHNPNSISIGYWRLNCFCRIHNRDRQTDRQPN